MERRTIQLHRPRLVRSTDGKPSRIEGYAAVYYREGNPGTEYELFKYASFRCVERLLPGCFDRAVREDDVRALFNHDVSLLLGRTSAGTCKLSADAMGLRYEITPPDASYARDLMACLARGDVSGSSFSFDYLDRSERDIIQPDGSELAVLEVRDVKLYDVGPVTFPAYASTTAEARRQITWTPKRMAARAKQVEKELHELGKVSRSKLSRRERIKQEAAARVCMLDIDGAFEDVLEARRLKAASSR